MEREGATWRERHWATEGCEEGRSELDLDHVRYRPTTSQSWLVPTITPPPPLGLTFSIKILTIFEVMWRQFSRATWKKPRTLLLVPDHILPAHEIKKQIGNCPVPSELIKLNTLHTMKDPNPGLLSKGLKAQ